MEKYEVNEETLVVLPYEYGKSKIIENNKEYIIEEKAFKIMEESCEYFGSSYQGRVDGARKMLGANYKLPIIVEETRQIIFFPTTSPLQEDCSWISLRHVEKVENRENKTIITFKNGQEFETTVSTSSINNQLLRAARLDSILNYRKKSEKRVY